jgi:hypothetical protein
MGLSPYMQEKKEDRDALIAAGFNPPPLSERAGDYHFDGGGHHDVIVDDCEFCYAREEEHKSGKHSGSKFKQGCLSCHTEFPGKGIPKHLKGD